jgi:hypothetical protein
MKNEPVYLHSSYADANFKAYSRQDTGNKQCNTRQCVIAGDIGAANPQLVEASPGSL